MSKKNVFVIDSYDSFTYNLVHDLKALGCHVKVKRNDAFRLDEIKPFEYLLLSPGPGLPEESGLLLDAIKLYAPTKNIFGVCLGQQAIAESFGGELVNLDKVYHGVATKIQIKVNDSLFEGLPNRIDAGRYHSWAVKPPLPSCLTTTSVDLVGNIMSLRHNEYKVRSVQFHPESILTPHGKKIIENWLNT